MRALDKDSEMFCMGEGCAFHGDEGMRDCSLCGVEFCLRCHPGRAICPDCRETEEEDSDPLDLDDADDARKDDEVERLLKEADALPPEDLDEHEA